MKFLKQNYVIALMTMMILCAINTHAQEGIVFKENSFGLVFSPLPHNYTAYLGNEAVGDYYSNTALGAIVNYDYREDGSGFGNFFIYTFQSSQFNDETAADFFAGFKYDFPLGLNFELSPVAGVGSLKFNLADETPAEWYYTVGGRFTGRISNRLFAGADIKMPHIFFNSELLDILEPSNPLAANISVRYNILN